ncbi:G-type lectin S-receptor-like serine/threonine-protein kinase [Acorus calamus]|uniref:G-type lectin S-receptor-like serine/threonine-protein kinase n=1 Tax=Acorus calamus TaxID=4465 RepID=A0AAV9DQU7_ACOCL|nr:G-type lectin S-receptor-like serine/threonine-protein kinase [Acorus calamus]
MERVKNVRIDHEDVNQIEDIQPQVFDLAMLRNATDNFSDVNKLGEGGFGVVYKGTLADGQEISVKRLSRTSGQGIQELRNEAVLVVRLQHRNLIPLSNSLELEMQVSKVVQVLQIDIPAYEGSISHVVLNA